MKKYNYLLAGLLAAATFTACSNEDGVENGKQESVDGFYMTLSMVGGTQAQTRTKQNNEEKATPEESKITACGLYLYDGAIKVFQKDITEADWASQPGENKPGTSNPIKVSVNNVTENKDYNVYFLANTTANDPLTATITDYAGASAANKFVMFNQNDPSVGGGSYTVTFTADNKSKDKAAKVSAPIKVERVVARIDAPTAEPTEITVKEGVTDEEKAAAEDAKAKIKSITYQGYALGNLAKKSNLEQKWSGDVLQMPKDMTYDKAYSTYGTVTEVGADVAFGTDVKNYLFENTTPVVKYATTMYFKYKALLKSPSTELTDGTFYRYDGVVYSNLADIIKSANTNPFGKTADELLKMLDKDGDKVIDAPEKEISDFRTAYNIEVYERGEVYYRLPVQDKFYSTQYSILRNSIYQLNVKNIYNLGFDVPNGEDNKKPNYYMEVQVQVNPWVLNAYDVNLGE